MKLIRFGEAGKESPGIILQDSTRLDVSSFTRDYDEAFFAEGGLAGLEQWLSSHTPSAPRVAQSVRLGPSIARPSKIVCIGLNFHDHAQESKMEIPKEPVIFFKATTSLVGPNDYVVIPKNGSEVDWEVGAGCRYRQKSQLRRARRRAPVCSRLCLAQRLFRARLSTGARRSMGQGEERR